MKRKGFTLIELLAVIVILAVLMVIAVPKILDVIENSRKSAAKSSAELYIDAIEKNNAIANVAQNATKIDDGTYDVTKLDVKVKGEKPTNGELTIEKGKVTSADICVNNYQVKFENRNAKVIGPCSEKIKTGASIELSTNGETYKAIVYLDPTNYETKCDSTNSISTPGTKEGCMKFYAYAETNSTYDLILDHNTTAKVAWGSSTAEMNHAQAALDADTANWVETARIISANEIARITGHDTFDSATTSYGAKFYFETNTRTAPNPYTKVYAWLYDYTSGCASTGCNISDSSTDGYWTSSVASGADGYIWTVIKLGDLDVAGPQYGSYYGIRPVITISKNIL